MVIVCAHSGQAAAASMVPPLSCKSGGVRKRTDSWSLLTGGRDIRQRKSGIKGRRDVQLRANQTIGLIEVGGGLLLFNGARVQTLPLRLTVSKLRPGNVRRETDDVAEGFAIALEIGVSPALRPARRMR